METGGMTDQRISVTYIDNNNPPLDSEMGWTGELWPKTNLLKKSKTQSIVFFQQKKQQGKISLG